MDQVVKDLHLMRLGKEFSVLHLRRTHDINAFEDVGMVEQMAVKSDCSLFALGTHQKKRPDNLILGRLFSSHLLDMFEFRVSNYVPANKFQIKEIDYAIKPILLF